jgi:hypothetical protein
MRRDDRSCWVRLNDNLTKGVRAKLTCADIRLHLILVSFPVAFWTGALFTDIVGGWRHDRFCLQMSVVLIAIVPRPRKARRLARDHLIWSLGATVVFALALYARARGWKWGIALSVAGRLRAARGRVFWPRAGESFSGWSP